MVVGKRGNDMIGAMGAMLNEEVLCRVWISGIGVFWFWWLGKTEGRKGRNGKDIRSYLLSVVLAMKAQKAKGIR